MRLKDCGSALTKSRLTNPFDTQQVSAGERTLAVRICSSGRSAWAIALTRLLTLRQFNAWAEAVYGRHRPEADVRRLAQAATMLACPLVRRNPIQNKPPSTKHRIAVITSNRLSCAVAVGTTARMTGKAAARSMRTADVA
jgi:hypothetical protein